MSGAAPPRSVKVWDLSVRLFHWLLVLAVGVAFLSAEEESVLNQWHVTAGWIAALLIAFRLAWGFVGGEHARFSNFLRLGDIGAHIREIVAGRAHPQLGHNPLGAVAVVALLGLIAATIATGLAGSEDAHETIANTLLVLIAVHVTAIVVMSVLARDNLVRAMITGRKPISSFPEAHDARPPSRLAWPLAAIVLGVSAYLALRIDPLAFMPHAAEAGESEAGEEGDD